MPIHDWTRVSAGTFHDLHCTWIPLLKIKLNDGLLPRGYDAQVEQVAGELTADVLTLESGGMTPLLDVASRGDLTTNVLTLESDDADDLDLERPSPQGGIAVGVAPPRVELTASLESVHYAARARRLVVRHSSADRVVAVIEVVSRGNKASQRAWRTFVQKCSGLILGGTHLVVVDLFPPGPRDPQGIHGAIWTELGDDLYHMPPEKPLTAAAYAADEIPRAYVQPLAVGDVLPPMPLFVTADVYVNVPLEETYQAAYHSVPQRWRKTLEAK